MNSALEPISVGRSNSCHMTATSGAIYERIEKAREHANLKRYELEERADLGSGWLSKRRQKIDTGKLASIARVCSVRVEWLAHGSGAMDSADPQHDLAHDPGPVREDTPFERALVGALDPERHSLRDLDALRSVVRRIDLMARLDLNLSEAAKSWLDASARLRGLGIEVTVETLLGMVTPQVSKVVEAREAAANADADAELRAKGMEPGAGAAAVEKLRKRRA